jgi:hypothetical protein
MVDYLLTCVLVLDASAHAASFGHFSNGYFWSLSDVDEWNAWDG